MDPIVATVIVIVILILFYFVWVKMTHHSCRRCGSSTTGACANCATTAAATTAAATTAAATTAAATTAAPAATERMSQLGDLVNLERMTQLGQLVNRENMTTEYDWDLMSRGFSQPYSQDYHELLLISNVEDANKTTDVTLDDNDSMNKSNSSPVKSR